MSLNEKRSLRKHLRIPNGTNTDVHTWSWSSAVFACRLRALPLRLRLPIFTLALLSIDWNADARNIRGLNFYNRLGAEITEQSNNRCFLKWIPS